MSFVSNFMHFLAANGFSTNEIKVAHFMAHYMYRCFCVIDVGAKQPQRVIAGNELGPITNHSGKSSRRQTASGSLQGQPSHCQTFPRQRSADCYSARQTGNDRCMPCTFTILYYYHSRYSHFA